jgi:AMP deaminase
MYLSPLPFYLSLYLSLFFLPLPLPIPLHSISIPHLSLSISLFLSSLSLPLSPSLYLSLPAQPTQVKQAVFSGPTTSYAFTRLELLSAKFNLHILLNGTRELNASKSVPHRDFYNVRKVDTHVHHSVQICCIRIFYVLSFFFFSLVIVADMLFIFVSLPLFLFSSLPPSVFLPLSLSLSPSPRLV